MDPPTVRWTQAVPWAIIAPLTTLACGRAGGVAVLTLSGLAAVLWAALSARYARLRNPTISAVRAAGDRTMRDNALLAFLPGVVAGGLVMAIGLDSLLEPAQVAWAVSVPLPAILLSSAADWYVILPFRDGAQRGHPACMVDLVPVSRRRRYAYAWVAHRLACEVSIAIALLVGALMVINHNVDRFETLDNLLSVLSAASAITALAWRRWVIGGLRFCLRQRPGLANWVSWYDEDARKRRQGFVRDVSLDNGVKVVKSPDARERFIRLADAVPDISKPQTGYGCESGHCKTWLRTGEEVTCEVYLRGRDAEG